MDTTTRPDDETDGPAASELVAACEHAWQAIQTRHPGVPHAVVILGTGVERGRLVKLGHWWAGRWIADGEPRGEVLLAGEALHLPAADVFEVLLHEAAHGLNAARHVKDTSRGGRYHNRHFKQTAETLGLDVAKLGPYGWAQTSLRAETESNYAAAIDGVAAAMRIARALTRPAPRGRDGTDRDDTRQGAQGAGPALCGCGRRMRMAPSVLAQGPVICGLCHEPFSTGPREATRAPTVEDRQSASVGLVSSWSAREWKATARQMIADACADPAGRRQFAQVAAWFARRRAGRDPTLTAATGRERDELGRLARAVLIVEGDLHAPIITVDGRELAVGEHVQFADISRADARDLDGHVLPAAGMLGTVTHVDPDARQVTVDVPIAGEYRIAVDSAGLRILRYAYVDPSPGPRDHSVELGVGGEVDVGCER